MRYLSSLFATAATLVALATFAAAAPPEHVTLQLKWTHQFQFAGYYAALEKGFYEREGLEVTLVEGGPGTSPAAELASGRAQYAVDGPNMLLEYLKGEPVAVLAAVFQHSPVALMAYSGSGIHTLADLAGKKIDYPGMITAEVRAMFLENGLDPPAPSLPGGDPLNELVSGSVDAVGVYLTNEPFLFHLRGEPVVLIRPRAHGIDFYGDCLFASRYELDTYPDRAERFLSASLKGWAYAMEHQDEMAQIIKRHYAPDKSIAHLRFEAEAMAGLILPRLVEVGTMNPERWRHIARVYTSLNLAPPGRPLDGFIHDSRHDHPEMARFAAWSAAVLAVLGLGALALYVLNKRLRNRLVKERRTLDTVFSVSPYGLALCRDRTLVWANPAMARMFGYPVEDLPGQNTRVLYQSDEDYGRVGRALEQARRGSGETVLDMDMRHSAGQPFSVQLSLKVVDRNDPGADYIVSLVDITRRKRTEQHLRLAANVFTQSSESVIITDQGTTILDCNEAFTRITGHSRENAVGATPRILKSGRHDAAFYSAMWRSIASDGVWQGEIWNRKKDGELFPCWLRINAVKGDDGRVSNYVGTFSDLTELKKSEESIYRLNNFDLLTGLPNRAQYLNLLAQEIGHARKDDESLGVLVLDLDNFKAVNETLGISQGDEVLREAARRLSPERKGWLTAARLGSDEFALLFRAKSGNGGAASVIQAVQETVLRPFELDQGAVVLSCTVGVSMFPDDAAEAEDLLKNAENALHHALGRGPGSYAFFSGEMTQRTAERLRVATALRQALAEEQFLLYYQPKVDIADGTVSGAEALIRWRHPEWGLMQPGSFIEQVESSDLVFPVGAWVLKEACAALARLRDAGFGDLNVAVNVSPRQFLECDVLGLVTEALDEYGLRAGDLELEITEALLVRDVELVSGKLKALKELGVALAVDDFGTGYSSLAYLTTFPLDTLKIDRSFISRMEYDQGQATITSTVVAMARTLGMSVVAEGVENETHVAMLRELGCHKAQGYHYSRPLPEEEFLAFLRAARTPKRGD